MNNDFIHGVIPPLITPTDMHERVEEHALKRVVDHVIEGGVHGILALGSNGEFFSLAAEEHERAILLTVKHAAGRVPVYMGIGAIATRECVRLARLAELHGAQAVTILPPMFIGPNEEELYQHFKTVADAISLPLLIYNNPDRLQVNISPRLLERLAEVPNIVGVKDSSGDLALTAEYIMRTRSKGFKVLAGRDLLIFATLAYGGVGCVATTANMVPELVVEIYDKYRAGDLDAAREAQYRLAPLRLAFNFGSFPAMTKDAMNLMGFEVGELIKPITSCSPERLQALRDILKAAGAKVVK